VIFWRGNIKKAPALRCLFLSGLSCEVADK
jgi:hypothetical protein